MEKEIGPDIRSAEVDTAQYILSIKLRTITALQLVLFSSLLKIIAVCCPQGRVAVMSKVKQGPVLTIIGTISFIFKQGVITVHLRLDN